ncbi:hypothetical protein N9B77_03675 [Flavobacteriaceae bacterium]|nr:hypothetical protein [Flavobacteriaceae bacterium]
MKLKKEVYEDLNTPQQFYTKIFDELGNLIYEYDGYTSSKYEYDSANRIKKIKYSYSNNVLGNDQKRESIYEYNESGYRVTTLKTQIIEDYLTTDKLDRNSIITIEQANAEYYKDVNEIVQIIEYFTLNDILQSKKTTDFESNKFYQEDYIYSENLLIEQQKFEINNAKKELINSINFEYDNQNRLVEKIEKDLLCQDKKILKMEYLENTVIENLIDDGLLIRTISKYDAEKLKSEIAIVQSEEAELLTPELAKEAPNGYEIYERQFLYIREYDAKTGEEFLSHKIEGEIIDNEFKIRNITKFEYYN